MRVFDSVTDAEHIWDQLMILRIRYIALSQMPIEWLYGGPL